MKNFEKGLILVEDNKLEKVAGGMNGDNNSNPVNGVATPATPATPVSGVSFGRNLMDFHIGLIYPKGVSGFNSNGGFFNNRIQAVKYVCNRMSSGQKIGLAAVDGGLSIGGATVIGLGGYLIYEKCFKKGR